MEHITGPGGFHPVYGQQVRDVHEFTAEAYEHSSSTQEADFHIVDLPPDRPQMGEEGLGDKILEGLKRCFILKSDSPDSPEASILARVGHAFLGVAKLAGLFSAGAFLIKAQIFCLFVVGPIAGVIGVICALASKSPKPVYVAAAMTLSPALVDLALVKSSYQDFKLTVTGRA